MKKKKVVSEQKLAAILDSITTGLSDSDKAEERSQRTLVLGALKRYANSRFHVGEALVLYKQACKVDGIWLRASEAIAKHMSISQRTLFRIVSDYERVSGLSPAVLSAMEAEGFDPAKHKNALLVEQVTEAIGDDSTPEEAQEVVRHTAVSRKQHKRKGTTPEDERIVWGLRQDIRKWLSKVPDDRQWPLLQRAISEEAFEVWGVTEPWQPCITPQASPRMPSGQQCQTLAVAA